MTRIVEVELELDPKDSESDGSLSRAAARKAGVDHLPSRVTSVELRPMVRATVRLVVEDQPEERNASS